jgi:hypothetical protein
MLRLLEFPGFSAIFEPELSPDAALIGAAGARPGYNFSPETQRHTGRYSR